MSSAFGGLNTVVRGLTAQQMALNTVGHNISNANTDGYSRQSVGLVATLPESVYGSRGEMRLGTGVDMQSITRARDTFMDQQMWKENSTLGSGDTQLSLLGQVEGVFQEPSDTGIQSVLDKFWSSLQTLGTDASNDSTRNLVVQRGVELVNTVQQANTQLKNIVSGINTDLTLQVTTVNQISSDILSLNRMISQSESAGNGSGSANDLRDRRDLLVDQLSKLVNVRVTEDKDGNYSVQSGSVNLVNGYLFTTLETYSSQDADYGYEVLNIKANGMPVTIEGGEIGGMMSARDAKEGGIKGYLDSLATMSKFLLRDFNAIHRAGFGEDDVSGRNFFCADTSSSTTNYADPIYLDPTNTANFMHPSEWIAALKVNPKFFVQNPTVPGDVPGLQMIAAKTRSTQGNASGDNAVILSEAMKKPIDPAWFTKYSPVGTPATPPTLSSATSLDSFYASLIGDLGVQTQSLTRMTENQTTVVNQIENWRQSVSGVNMDEEMSNMIRFQKGYNAAARMVTTMDEMFDKLINGMGVVGR